MPMLAAEVIIEKAISKLQIGQRKREIAKLSKPFASGLKEIFEAWEESFNRFASKNRIHEILFNKASSYWMAGRRYKFKSINPVDPKYLLVVDGALAAFRFNASVLAKKLLFHQAAAFALGGQMALDRASSLADVSAGRFILRDLDLKGSIQDRANLFAGNISDELFTKIRWRISKSYFEEGKHPTHAGVDPLTGKRVTSVSSDLRGMFGRFSRSKSDLVARTETMAMESHAHYEYNLRTGVQKHGWLTVGDRKVRPAHALNDGAEVKLGDPFPSGQIRVGQGSPELVILCRCDNYPVITETPKTFWRGE